ncbi:MAG: hypothetical protein IV112_20345 [Methyloversatilis discipulorum]|uniref:hypothetical protein n=1 Tax=Methyloversatilis discipulorum TaxID=1119528 RepID=UPI0026EAC210|nr:hypothetical protein [Methyloversatilis discipulorum]MBT9519038.1 hypothetical protein [Methyloversatilis discipulorum]
MPLGEIASEVLSSAFRFVGQVLIDLVAEVIVKGPGYLICRLFSKDVDPDGMRVAVVGILFWITLATAAWAAWGEISASADMDRCLDAGGKYDDQLRQCRFK